MGRDPNQEELEWAQRMLDLKDPSSPYLTEEMLGAEVIALAGGGRFKNVANLTNALTRAILGNIVHPIELPPFPEGPIECVGGYRDIPRNVTAHAKSSRWRRALCWIGWHKSVRLTYNFGDSTYVMGCIACKKTWFRR